MILRYLIPASPRTVWKLMTLQPLEIMDHPRVKSLDRLGYLIAVPLAVMFSPIIVGLILVTSPSDFEFGPWVPLDPFEWGFFVWGASNMYWLISILCRIGLEKRAAVSGISESMIAAGKNPNATVDRQR